MYNCIIYSLKCIIVDSDTNGNLFWICEDIELFIYQNNQESTSL